MKEKPTNYGMTPTAFVGFGFLMVMVMGIAIVVPAAVRLMTSWF